ncbi:MAG: hypothetical protein ABIP03_06280 [Aquihabitans sp.]
MTNTDSVVAAPIDGPRIVRADIVATAAFVLVTLVTSLVENEITDLANLVVSAALFLGGCVAFGIGFVRAANRSRTEVVDLAGLFYLTGSAPKPARRMLMGLWFAQIATAVVSVFTISPPFGVMAPVWGIGILTLWSSRYATFPKRPSAAR